MDSTKSSYTLNTENGKIVVSFTLNKEQEIPHGFVTCIGARYPTAEFSASAALIVTTDGKTTVGYNVSTAESKIIVWEYKDINSRDEHDPKRGKIICGVSTLDELTEITQNRRGYFLHYQDTSTGEWLSAKRAATKLAL